MQGSDLPVGRRMELYVRSLLPDGYHQRQTALEERLSALVESGHASERSVHVWGKQAPATREATTTDIGQFALERVELFREWAAVNDCSLAPAFEVRQVDNRFTDDRYRAIRFPSVLLAEFRGDALTCVTPHASEDGVMTVGDRLASLEAENHTRFKPIDHVATEETQTDDDSPLLGEPDREPLAPE
ncbi:HTH domain-containing protein [Haloarcula amylovorans]|uniref:HTH domain-containing protein n=1 Tax=Haloarcula amylovorans TaxID=2562280 RepID=UPI00107685FC|nr:HTH domain-containing protein [Halomicroarcula amylolytica]